MHCYDTLLTMLQLSNRCVCIHARMWMNAVLFHRKYIPALWFFQNYLCLNTYSFPIIKSQKYTVPYFSFLFLFLNSLCRALLQMWNALCLFKISARMVLKSEVVRKDSSICSWLSTLASGLLKSRAVLLLPNIAFIS